MGVGETGVVEMAPIPCTCLH